MAISRIKRIIFAVFMVFFFSNTALYSEGDKKEELRNYLKNIDPVLTRVQITTSNFSQKLLTMESVISEMKAYIDTIHSLRPPEFIIRQHKMMLLSLKKLRMGFYMLSSGDRLASVRLVNRGRDLLRLAVKDIVKFGKDEGLIKGEDEIAH